MLNTVTSWDMALLSNKAQPSLLPVSTCSINCFGPNIRHSPLHQHKLNLCLLAFTICLCFNAFCFSHFSKAAYHYQAFCRIPSLRTVSEGWNRTSFHSLRTSGFRISYAAEPETVQ